MSLNENLEAYNMMQEELIRKYHGKVAVFHRGKLVAVDKDLKRAIEKARQKTRAKDFFIRELYRPEEQASAIL
jgi:hypothetical protein